MANTGPCSAKQPASWWPHQRPHRRRCPDPKCRAAGTRLLDCEAVNCVAQTVPTTASQDWGLGGTPGAGCSFSSRLCWRLRLLKVNKWPNKVCFQTWEAVLRTLSLSRKHSISKGLGARAVVGTGGTELPVRRRLWCGRSRRHPPRTGPHAAAPAVFSRDREQDHVVTSAFPARCRVGCGPGLRGEKRHEQRPCSPLACSTVHTFLFF